MTLHLQRGLQARSVYDALQRKPQSAQPRRWPRVITVLVTMLLAGAVSGCVVAPYPPRYGYAYPGYYAPAPHYYYR